MASSSVPTVAKITYNSASIVLDVVGPKGTSPFQPIYQSLTTASPSIVTIPRGADAGLRLNQHASKAPLVTLTLQSDREVLTRLIPRLSALADSPVVIHVAATGDISDALALKTVVPFFLHSSTSQQAHDHALLAARLAKVERKLVLHLFYTSTQDDVSELDGSQLRSFLSEGPGGLTNGNLNGNGWIDGQDEALTQLLYKFEAVASHAQARLQRPLFPFSFKVATTSSPTTLLVTLGQTIPSSALPGNIAHIDVSLVQPFSPVRLRETVPSTIKTIIVLEQVYKWPTKWTPLFLDILSASQLWEEPRPQIISGTLGEFSSDSSFGDLIPKLLENVASGLPRNELILGSIPSHSSTPLLPHVPKHEAAYTKALEYVFGDRLEISNSPRLVPNKGEVATKPEYALGRVQVHLEQRAELTLAVRQLLDASRSLSLPQELSTLCGQWLLGSKDASKSGELGYKIVQALESSNLDDPAASKILSLAQYFPATSHWIIGSDAWSYDLGASGLHHTIASGSNVNTLLLDTTPYSDRHAADPEQRKKDVGLYAMNHGDVYVTSVAIYSSYGHVLRALMEADKFDGPSIVLAYLPYTSESDTALTILKETKLAVDSGYWPLYRWDPSKEQAGLEPFSLDSEALKDELREFLDKQNHLSQLTAAEPRLAAELVGSLGATLADARRAKAKQAYEALLGQMNTGPPLLILYASDGGTAEKYAKRLGNRCQVRGVTARVQTMDSMPIAEVKKEEYVAFITSTAGQGEFPQNGRDTSKALNAAAARSEKLFKTLKYTIFGLGDSHYWPRPEDAHYYNKPSKDLDARLEQLGGERVAALGLGDDQDADGPMTGYKIWEPLLWRALGVEGIEVQEAEPEPVTNENIKIASNFLRGTIVEGLADLSTGNLAPTDIQLTKFHGIYEQDDRDIRDERKAQGLEPAYSFMIRVRMPGGVCRPEQWLAMDRISDEHGNGTFKLTTRQTFQFHGVIKRHLKPTIQAINRALLDTIAACGDVNRNVLVSSLPSLSHLHEEAYHFGKKLSEKLLPKTTAYHEIWLDKKMVAGDAVKDIEPMYGPYYLPRKFKIAVAIPPNNDVDLYANDVGFVAIADKHGRLVGFNVTAGGGMGVTHGNKKTYPRTADVLGFCTVDQAYIAAEKILLTQRDNGNREDRKNARLKYTIDRMGLDAFKAEVETRQGFTFQPARPFNFTSNVDEFGWVKDRQGKSHFTCFIENGRVQDEPGKDFKTGLREIATIHKGRFRLTANQHLIISEVPDAELPKIKELLKKYGLDNLQFSGLRLSSSACVAFPTCGLAMAESERYLPILIDKVEKICEENGLRNDSIVMRMTGCPNGCARPYLAEVAFVGKAPGSYVMLLGGGYYGQRTNKIYRENVSESQILAILRPMIKRYALERLPGERFGDFTIRAGYISAVKSGKEWYDGMGGEGEYAESLL